MTTALSGSIRSRLVVTSLNDVRYGKKRRSLTASGPGAAQISDRRTHLVEQARRTWSTDGTLRYVTRGHRSRSTIGRQTDHAADWCDYLAGTLTSRRNYT
jgi:capsid protein